MAYTTIDNPELYFQVKLYTGNATSDTAITLDGDENMQPDLVWIKERNSTSNNEVVDSVRGATKFILTDSTNAEGTEAEGLKSFDSDGFTLGDNGSYNQSSSYTYVAWCWKETADAGFDIVSYTGNGSARTISHSLSAKPRLIIQKNRSAGSTQWRVQHGSLGAEKHMALDATQAVGDASSVWNDTEPTTSVFSVGDDAAVNGNTNNCITYLWAEKQGFSKFGKYTGNNNSNGTFVYTGFRPAWVMIKMSDSTKSWQIYDNKRFTSNPINAYLTLNADTTAAESYGTVYPIDFLSNGFKFHTDTSEVNASNTYIYMAFAEATFVNSKGVPCNAR